MDVEHPTAVLTGAAARDALDQQLRVDVEQHHSIERLPDACEHAVEALSLRDGAREPIEDEAAAGVRFGKPLANHAEDGRIVDRNVISCYDFFLENKCVFVPLLDRLPVM